MLTTQYPIGIDVSLSHSNIDMISQFVNVVTPAFASTQPRDSILGLAPNFLQCFKQLFWKTLRIHAHSYDLILIDGG